MTEHPWPDQAIFPTRGLSEREHAIEPRAWQFVASDGYPIHVLTFAPTTPARGRVIVVHGVQSHAGWYTGLARRLAAAGFETHCPDRRGSGANMDARGHAESARRLVDDLAELSASLSTHDAAESSHPRLPLALVGISWGAKLVVTLAASGTNSVAAVVLVCPGLHPRVGISRRERVGVGLALVTGRGATRRFPIPLSNPALFTEDRTGQAFIASDPLSLRDATASLLFASRMLDTWVARSPARLKAPTLLMLAEHDRIVDNAKTRAYFQTIASPRKQMIEYPGKHHTMEFDVDSHQYADDIVRWLTSEDLAAAEVPTTTG